jgi:type IV pilus assembly protein PilC
MPKYFYTARSRNGEPKSGILEVKDSHELARVLHQEGYTLVSASLDEGGKKIKRSISIPFLSRVSLKEKMFFARNLRVMITSGLALPRALKTLADQSKSKKFRKAILDVRDEIVKGKSFSESLSSHQDIFSELFQNMIKVGEESGTLEDVLKVLTDQMEREHRLKSSIMGAMIYPAVIICAMIGIGILMLIMVVPQLAITFKELDIALPPTTQLVIFLGTFMAEKWYLVILIVLFLLILLRVVLRTRSGKILINKMTLKIPIISGIVKNINSAYTTRTLGSLITAGVPIVRSLEIVSGTLGNIYFKEAMVQAAEKVKKGQKLFEALTPYQNLYPSLVLQMIEVGEETGETSTILIKLADFFEEEVTNATKNLSSVIEPVLMLIIGGIVGFFAISMVQPMYSMLGAIK